MVNLTEDTVKLTRYIYYASVVLCIISLSLLILCFLIPLGNQQVNSRGKSTTSYINHSISQYELKPLLEKMMLQRLIRPAQIQAAVKDDGLAQKLVKKLKLQGIVLQNEHYIAYVRLPDKRTARIRDNDMIIDFNVDRITSQSVTLSLNGVQVELR